MEEVRKRQAGEAADDGGEDSAVKKPKPTEMRAGPDSADHDDDDDDCISAWLTLDDDAVSELLDLLEPAESSPSSSSSSAAGAAFNFKVKFIDDPYASPLVFQASSSFVTINGNEESCGSSFSESETTVMASIDTRGIGALRVAGDEVGRGRVAEGGGAWGAGSGEARGCGMEGCDCGFGVVDGDVVAGFLGEQGVEEEEMLLTGLK